MEEQREEEGRAAQGAAQALGESKLLLTSEHMELDTIRLALEHTRDMMEERTVELNTLQLVQEQDRMALQEKETLFNIQSTKQQCAHQAREAELQTLAFQVEQQREDVNGRLDQLQQTRRVQDVTATARLKEVEELKEELLKMQIDRRKGLTELTKDKELTRQQLTSLQEASRSIEAEKEELIVHVQTVAHDNMEVEVKLKEREDQLQKDVYRIQKEQQKYTFAHDKEQQSLKDREDKVIFESFILVRLST